MDKVYILTNGYYSSYRIRLVFATREAAEEALVIFDRERGKWSDEGEIEEWDVYPTAQRTLEYTCWVPLSGKPLIERHEPVWGPVTERTYEQSHGVGGVAMTPERARKIAQDRAAQIKAEKAGIT